VNSQPKWAILDLETRCNLALAREVLDLAPCVDPLEVCQRLIEQKHAESSGFLKLPFHEPVCGGVLLAERRQASPEEPIVATGWLCWRAGEAPLEQFVGRFFESIAGRVCVGFNSTGFDLPLMELWACRLRVAAPAYFGSPHSPRVAPELHCDLQREAAGALGRVGRFDLLCKFHGLPGKPGMSGKDVESMVASGRLDEVQAYNVTDVLQSFLLLLHLQVRSGALTREAAAISARGAIELTRSEVGRRLPAGSRALELLDSSLRACGKAPIADAG
jgi:predicted PolB exonuclease-like 3'-5' exonuclease